MQGCWALSQDATGRGPHSNAAAMQRQSRDPKSSNPLSHYTVRNNSLKLYFHSLLRIVL
uniref:Uncharacterized protein n=1 Tax=Drosophila melanogaster TaxID=7227 RepID=A0A0B4LGW0_DROME|nr:uncharacterized protein Dmel_CG45545 [Drosophila melanogaster]AHN57210.1 uncharacterized protein Dmel_CG45545 [Drosophila melanogaster]|eukprot:NP_001287211.1 uncharacterized protein Dmel_CG45545 [Drosophila melanogaster]